MANTRQSEQAGLPEALKDHARAQLRKRATWSKYYWVGTDKDGNPITDGRDAALACALSPYFHLGQAVAALWKFHMATEGALLDAPGRYSPTLKKLEPSRREAGYEDFMWLYERVVDETDEWITAWRDMARNLPPDSERPWDASVHWEAADLLASAAEAFISDCLSSALLAASLDEAPDKEPAHAYWIGRAAHNIRVWFPVSWLTSRGMCGAPKEYEGRSLGGHIFAPHQLPRQARLDLGMSEKPDVYSGWL